MKTEETGVKEAIARQAIDEAVEIIKPLVVKIERGVQLTKYHYAKYVEMLSRVPSTQRQVFCLVLLKAGANKEGVEYAYRIVGVDKAEIKSAAITVAEKLAAHKDGINNKQYENKKQKAD